MKFRASYGTAGNRPQFGYRFETLNADGTKNTLGHMWFATYGGGATRYDPNSFHHFTINEGLSFNHVYQILEDSKGNLWFGTGRHDYPGNGLNIYDGHQFTHIKQEEGLF